MTTPLYQLTNVIQRYNGRPALHVDELAIEQGSILGLAGHNGSGKSTLLRILAMIEAPRSGRLLYDGKECVGDLTEKRQEITLLTQDPYLLKRSVRNNVCYGYKIRDEKCEQERIDEAMEMVGLNPAEFLPRSWHELSGGEAQRVALASRLILKPRVLLLDEPTASLDPESTLRIHQAAVQARDKWGTTLVVVSHDLPWLTSVADSVLTFASGRITGELGQVPVHTYPSS